MRYVVYVDKNVFDPGPRIHVGIFEKEGDKTITAASGMVGKQYLGGNGRIPKEKVILITDDLKRVNKALGIQRCLLNVAEAVAKAAKDSYTAEMEKLISGVKLIAQEGDGKKEEKD